MSKNLFQDMVKINQTRRKFDGEIIQKSEIKQPEVMPSPLSVSRPRHTLWFVALAAVVFFLFALSYLFSKAEVLISPKIQNVVLNQNLFASLDGPIGDLSFDLVVIPGEETKIVKAMEEKEISQKAKGIVLIYNTFSSASQALNIDTRLEGSNGKMYKTETKTIVPGMAKDGTPGSVEVKIYASVAGEEYNSAPLDFKIFGFKGTTKYTKFYARSKGDIAGGFKGKSNVPSLEDKTTAISELKEALQAKLLQKATDQIPSGFILFKNATFLDINDVKDSELLSPNDTLPIKLQGTFYGFLFKEKELTQKIVEKAVEKYDQSEVYISNIQDLTFSLGRAGSSLASFKDLKNVNFNLSGPTKVVWKFDVEKLRAELLGTSKKNFYQILSQYPNINSADLSLSPIWKRSLPNKIEDIKILVDYPE